MKKIPNLTIRNNFLQYISVDDYNNIYFRDNITKENIMVLTRIIQEQNNKCENLKDIKKFHINLHITSDGGNPDAGFFAYDFIKRSKIPIHTYCEGMVASAASLLLLAGKKRFMYPNSSLLIHQLSITHNESYTQTFEDIKDEYYNEKQMMDKIINLYLKESKINEKRLRELLKRNIWLSAKYAKRFGFIDEIIK